MPNRDSITNVGDMVETESQWSFHPQVEWQGYLGKLGFQAARDHGAPQTSAATSYLSLPRLNIKEALPLTPDSWRPMAGTMRMTNQQNVQLLLWAMRVARAWRLSQTHSCPQAQIKCYVKEDQPEEDCPDEGGIKERNPVNEGSSYWQGNAHEMRLTRPQREETSANPGAVLGLNISMMENPAMTKKLLKGVIPPTEQGRGGQTGSRLGNLKTMVLEFSLAGHGREMREEATMQQARATSRIEMPLWRGSRKEVDKLKEKELLAKKSSIEEYKSSDEFQEVVEQEASRYFGEGFDLCKKQINCLHPNLNIQDMGIDAELAEEEEEEEEKEEHGEKEEKSEEKGKPNNSPAP
ncbi:hypothetical protein Acr_17g0007610 [Actinidia rufa]|uniref:Uncharacterized protein n=1 Tax=Actinidia rufa TaxID=165716 RepID=A0A7J0G335_9ERIC|nr:hypothetical protein Acr_17g0007610 [Actinidia rufa]